MVAIEKVPIRELRVCVLDKFVIVFKVPRCNRKSSDKGIERMSLNDAFDKIEKVAIEKVPIRELRDYSKILKR